MLFGQFQYCSKGSDTVRTVSFLSGRFQYCPDSFKTVRTVLILSGRFQYCLDGFNAVQTVSILSGWFQNCPDSFNTVWTINSQICIAFCILGTQFIWRSIEHHKKDDNTILYVPRDVNALSYVVREDDVSWQVVPHASSEKYLRVKCRYPESFRFLCLCCRPPHNHHHFTDVIIIINMKITIKDKVKS